MKSSNRKKRLVDASVQGRLITHVLAQWAILLLSVLITSLLMHFVLDPLQEPAVRYMNLKVMLYSFGIATVCLIPIFTWKLVKFSHRFVGPVAQLRRCFREAEIDQENGLAGFREDDHWQDLASEYNKMLSRLRADHLAALENQALESSFSEPVETHA